MGNRYKNEFLGHRKLFLDNYERIIGKQAQKEYLKVQIEKTERIINENLGMNPALIELDYINENCSYLEFLKSFLVKKAKLSYSYKWTGNIDEIDELFKLLKGKFVSEDNSLEHFKAIFSNQPINENFEPVKWHNSSASEVVYFIKKLQDLNCIEHKKRMDYKKLKSCFVKSDGQKFNENLKQLNTDILINLSKEIQTKIDEIIKEF